MKGTKIVIRALSSKGRLALKNQLVQDVEKRADFKRDPSGFTKNERNWFKTVSVADFQSDSPDRWEILGFKKMGSAMKQQIYLIIKKEFLSDDCTVDDFEVRFVDE